MKYWPNIYNNYDDYGYDLKCDIYEKNDKYYIVCDVPGYDKKDISISYDNNYLTISCYKEEINDQDYIRKERRIGKYERSFYTKNIDKDSISATYKNGVLTLEMKKLENNSKCNIEIK